MFPFDNLINDWNDGIEDSISPPITGTSGRDLILLDAGNNIANGQGGNDMIIGGPGGFQIFRGGTGNDILNGSAGNNDTVAETGDYSFTLSDSRLISDNGSGTSYTDILFGMEQAALYATGNGDNTIDASAFSGTTFLRVNGGNNTIIGSAQDDMILGGSGFDRISGGAGRDTIYGGGDDDTISGGSNNDSLNGGGGVDTLLASGDFDFLLLNTNLVTVRPNVTEIDTLSSFEKAVLEGGSSNNSIDASGFSGEVTLRGQGGVDILIGSPQNDLIVGGLLGDVLTSGSTLDEDIFLFNSISEGGDTITDFNTADSIQVEANGFAATGGAMALNIGVLAPNRFVLGTGDLGNNAGFRYDDSSGGLFFDSNGGDTAGSVLMATLANTPSFNALSGNIQVI